MAALRLGTPTTGERRCGAEAEAGGFQSGAAHGGVAEAEWAFPVYVAGPRRLPPDDVLFETGNLEREALAKQAALADAKDVGAHLAREAELADRALSSYLSHKHECATCQASMPTAHLLDIHVAEVHDSFFAAQAARRLPVFQCLVEGCGRKFCTVEERRQHLTDHHRFPRGRMGLDRIHLRRRKGQIRVLPQYRRVQGNGRKGMDTDAGAAAGITHVRAAGDVVGPGTLATVDPRSAAAGIGGGAPLQQEAAGAGQREGPSGATSMHEDVTQGLSRLSMAVDASSVPNVVSFGGRRAGRGLPGVPRGRGGRKSQPPGGAAV